MARLFDASGPFVSLSTYLNGSLVQTEESLLDPDYSFGTSERPWFDHMTGTSHFTVLEMGFDTANVTNNHRADNEGARQISCWSQHFGPQGEQQADDDSESGSNQFF